MLIGSEYLFINNVTKIYAVTQGDHKKNRNRSP